MSLFSAIRRKLLVARFKRKNLRIIEAIDASKLAKILNELIEQGWELAAQFDTSASLQSQGLCIVRRGQSTLTFTLSPNGFGTVVGPAPIVDGLATEYKLEVLFFPS